MYWANDEKTVYIAEYVGAWTWEEFYPALERANRDFEAIDHSADVIHDWSRCTRIPSDIMAHSRNLIKRMHPRTGINVHVGANTLFLSLWRAFVLVYTAASRQKKFFFTDTRDQALALLADLRRKTD
jgi:hypothetical protein